MVAINEKPIFGQMILSTAAWGTTSFVDHTSAVVGTINYSRGGRVGLPGDSQTQVGTLTATMRNVATPPAVGDVVRLRRQGPGEYAFIGYVQDVSQRIVFDSTVSYKTPVTLTTITCLDWVGYVSQFQAVGAAGLSAGTFVPEDNYNFQSRARFLNNVIDPTNATQMILATGTGGNLWVGDTDYVGTFSDHLDLLATTSNAYWYSTNVLPTNNTTGRYGLVIIRDLASAPSSGKTFTDAVGTAGQLHYTEIDLESSSQNVANTIVVNNKSLITTTSPTVPLFNAQLITQIGGGNRKNYNIVNGVEVVNVPYEQTWSGSDATSISTYGNRATEINTNLAGLVDAANLISNPSAEYSDAGYNGGANVIVRRRKPKDMSPAWSAYAGEWAIRIRQQSANQTGTILFQGAESDGTPVIAGNVYFSEVRAARGTPSRTDLRARLQILWLNDSETVISTLSGSLFNLTVANAWYQMGAAGTAPAGATRAQMNIQFSRSGGGNISAGDFAWCDALQLSENNVAYLDGDMANTNSEIYLWTGEVGLSPSFKINNTLDDTINTYLARYSTTSNRVTRIRWNVQEDITAMSALQVGSTTQITFKGTTTTYRIVGIDGAVSTNRYMIDYYLEKV